MKNLKSLFKKATRTVDIPEKNIKGKHQWLSTKIWTTIWINDCLEKVVFPDELKLADVTTFFKNDESHNKKNYGPISTLSHMSKTLVYEFCI